jgi:CRISPR-associated protein Cas5d
MAYGLRFRVWGDYALFSRPELKVERVSYDMITPSAARGLLDCIYWKPAIVWRIDKIHIINPILFTNIRRNEVAEVALLSSVKRAMNSANPYPYYIVAPEGRHQRAAMVLRDVEYVVEAHFDFTDKAGAEDTVEKHYNIALRRLRKGQFFQKPFLGTREFSASFEIIEKPEDIPKSCYAGEGERDLGYMLYDIGYEIDEKAQRQEVNPSFFRAVLHDGILDLSKVSGVVQ